MTATDDHASPTHGTSSHAAGAARRIPARRIDFPFGSEELPRHFMGGDLVFSHVVAMLSAAFPEGEDFFVASVRRYRDRIEDPALSRDVAGFIGQEAIHGREHRDLNEHLAALGYPTRGFDRFLRRLFSLSSRTLPGRDQLAITAALEHYTATFAEVLLTSEELRASTDSTQVRGIFLWHALEESEHKAVAFDVYRAVVGDEFHRRRVMATTSIAFVAIMAGAVTVSLAKDPAARDPRRLARSLRRLARNPLLSRQARSMVRQYFRTGFHPEDRDTAAILAEWRETLFGEDGELTAHLVSSRAA